MSNADKRTVTTDALETLGTIITENEKRDAIHLAVENAVAAHALRAGDHVGRHLDGRYGIYSDKAVGIVDPFLDRGVKEGQHFWLVVYPRQITSLRHVWTHLDFPEVAEAPKIDYAVLQIASIQWLEDFARQYDATYAELMAHAQAKLDRDDYWCEGDRFEGEHVPEEFWDHWEKATGKVATNRGNFFSCSC